MDSIAHSKCAFVARTSAKPFASYGNRLTVCIHLLSSLSERLELATCPIKHMSTQMDKMNFSAIVFYWVRFQEVVMMSVGNLSTDWDFLTNYLRISTYHN